MKLTDEQRAILARRGLAIAGIGRAGVARSGLTLAKLTLHLLAEREQFEQQIRDMGQRIDERDARSDERYAELQQKLDAVNDKLVALDRGRRRAQQQTTVKRREATEKFVRLVDEEIAKSDETDETAAFTRVLKKIGIKVRREVRRGRSKQFVLVSVAWTEATKPEQIKARHAARQRYRAWKSRHKIN